jgi:hypothetical protein
MLQRSFRDCVSLRISNSPWTPKDRRYRTLESTAQIPDKDFADHRGSPKLSRMGNKSEHIEIPEFGCPRFANVKRQLEAEDAREARVFNG